MKYTKILYSLLSIIFAVGMASCSGPDDGKEPAVKFILAPGSLEFNASTNLTQIVSIMASDIPNWEATVAGSAGSWLSVEKGTDKITVTATPCDDEQGRTGEIMISDLDKVAKTVTIPVTQNSPSHTFGLSHAKLYFLADNLSAKAVTVGGKEEWDVEVSQDATSWLTASKKDGKLMVEPSSANTGNDPRKGEITVTTSSGQKAVLPVTQDSPIEGIDNYEYLIGFSNGLYYGDRTNNGTGEFILTLNSAEGQLLFNGLGTLGTDNDNYILPEGRYTPALNSVSIPGTFIKGNVGSDLKLVGTVVTYSSNNNITDAVIVESGEIRTDNTNGEYTIVFSLSGKKYSNSEAVNLKYVYVGPVSFSNRVKEDKTYSWEPTDVFAGWYGDFYSDYNPTAAAVILYFYDAPNGFDDDALAIPPYKELQLELITNLSDGKTVISSGKYTSAGTGYSNIRFMPGFYSSSESRSYPCYYAEYLDSHRMELAVFLDAGSVTIDRLEGNYQVNVALIGDNYYTGGTGRINIEYNGPIEVYDFSEEQAPALMPRFKGGNAKAPVLHFAE